MYFQSLTTFKSIATYTNIRSGLMKLNFLQKNNFSTLRKCFKENHLSPGLIRTESKLRKGKEGRVV